MAKIYGLFGAITGKLADTVMAVRNGEQLARKYQPVVYNPSTPAQVETRAKLKTLSQLSAVMAPVIAIPRQGSVSARNLFTKKNYGTVQYADSTATVNLTAVTLTDSVVGLPSISAQRNTGGAAVQLNGVAESFDRVVYCVFERQADNSLRFVTSTVAQKDSDMSFGANITFIAPGALVIYAYGVRDNTEAARAKFANIQVLTAEMVASLVVSRTVTLADVTLSETQAFLLSAASRGEDEDTKKKK